jgi:hypothetical protein
MTKQQAAQKLVKLMALQSNSGSELGEKASASSRIKEICQNYHLRIEGNLIIDKDIEEENQRKQFEQLNKTQPPLQDSTINPEKTNMYVIFKGKKYYGGVPKEVYKKILIGESIYKTENKLRIVN